MKKIYFLMIIALAAFPAIACDICGAGVGGSYLGILPEFHKRFIGLRFQRNGLRNHLGPSGNATYLTTSERYHVMELWGAVNIGSRFRIAGFVPYNFIERNNQGQTLKHNGIGDVSAIGYYQLLNKRQTIKNDRLLVQGLWLGAGIKLPTGEYNPDEKNIEESGQNTFQLGTGSVDFSIHGMYDLRIQDFGINTNMSYKINTANRYSYQYGNKFTTNLLAYYKFRVSNSITVAPNSGMLFETASKDWKTSGIRVWETGGRSLMGTAGVELSLGKISTGANFQSPLSQHLGEGKVKAGNRAMVHVSVSF